MTVLADVAVSRLRLPSPGVKWAIVQSLADALSTFETQNLLWAALCAAIPKLEFESEIVEALAVSVAARGCPVVSAEKLRTLIAKPSLLSDILLSMVSDAPPLVRTWDRAHSGEAPSTFDPRKMLASLNDGRVAPLFGRRLAKLEQASNYPFDVQWAFEFEQLQRIESCSDGHWSYFDNESGGRNSTGQFVTRRSHAVRSAYLRTLAFAVDRWHMPTSIALEEAKYATPINRFFLDMPPCPRPSWVDPLYLDEVQTSKSVVRAVSEIRDTLSDELLHLNAALHNSARRRVELEVITAFAPLAKSPQDLFVAHEALPGFLFLIELEDSQLNLPVELSREVRRLISNQDFVPALLPIAPRHFGYMHIDLISRLPHMPANYTGEAEIQARSRKGGADISLQSESVGTIEHWNHRWTPTHLRGAGAPVGVALRLRSGLSEGLWSDVKLPRRLLWHVATYLRDSDYGDWHDEHEWGDFEI